MFGCNYSLYFLSIIYESSDPVSMTSPVSYIKTREGSILLLALALSLALHGVLAVAVLRVAVGDEPESAPSTVQIRLVASNPLVAEPEPEPIVEPAPELEPEPEIELDQETAEDELIAQSEVEQAEEPVELAAEQLLQEAAPTPSEQLPPAPATSLVELPSVELLQRPDALQESSESARLLPSIVNVRNTIQVLDAQDSSRYWNSDCNILETDAGIRDCEPIDSNDYALVDRNATYESLNPIRVMTRAERSLGVMTQQAPALAGRLYASDIPRGLSDYVMEEIEAGITHLSNPGNRGVQHMGFMLDKSAAAEQARRVLDDPWVQSQSRALRERNVHLD